MKQQTDVGDERALGVSDRAVREATGRGWDEWLAELDAAGAAAWTHKDIVRHLAGSHAGETTGWWRQAIAVGYEKARGKRVLGQTADAGFQVSVQRSVTATPAAVWDLVVTRPELWLGAGSTLAFVPGERYAADSDAGRVEGEIRVVKPADRLRLTWQPEGWPRPATVQLTLAPGAGGKTALQAHLEKLPDAASRERMRSHWRAVLERLAGELG